MSWESRQMSDWKAYVNADPTDWLLEKDNPSVQYLTLTEILDIPVNDPHAQKANAAIMETGVVPQILAKQEKDGYHSEE